MNHFTKTFFYFTFNVIISEPIANAQNFEKIVLEIPAQNSTSLQKVEISKAPDLESALFQIETEVESLAKTTDIIIAHDFDPDKNSHLKDIDNNPRYSLLPLRLREKVAAVETVQEISKIYRDKRYEVLPQIIEQYYKEKEFSYQKLRTPITIVKSLGVGVANFALYYSKFDNQFIPAFIWAVTTAAQSAAFQWKAPEINHDYRIITDAFFNKFEVLKKFAVPEFDDGSGRYKIRHRIVKNLGVILIGGWSVTNLYHLIGTISMFTILGSINSTTLLEIINEQSEILGIHFQNLTLQAIGVGFLVNQFISSLKELLSDVAPSCLLSSQLQRLSPENKRIAMALGSAFIGGMATILVSASQFLHFQGIKEIIWTLTLSGAAYSTYKYALKDFFSHEFIKEIEQDFRIKIGKYFLKKIEPKAPIIPQNIKVNHSCRVFLIAKPPNGFLTKHL